MSEIQPMPHAIGPEKSVLSTCMKNPHLIAEVPHGGDLFYLPAHRILFEQMAEAGHTLELIGFVETLHQRGLLDSVGGPSLIADIFTYAPNELHHGRHLAILQDRYARRLAIAAATAASEAAFDCSEGHDSQNYLSALGEPLQRVFDVAAGLKPQPDAKQLADEFKSDFAALMAGTKLPMGIETDIPEIDDAIRGLHAGHMGVISAFSEGGKSTLASQILCNVGSGGIPVAYFPMEGTMKGHFQRCVIQLSKLPAIAVVDPVASARANGRSKPSEEEFRAIRRALERLENPKLFRFEKPISRHVSTVCAAIRRAVRKDGTKLAVVDYLQLMRANRQKGDSGEREFSDISHAIQELADQLKITIIVLSQQNADGETKHARAIEEDCDFWLSVVQERNRESEDFKRHKHVLIAKDRHNGNGGKTIPLILDRELVRFVTGSWVPEKKRASRFAN